MKNNFVKKIMALGLAGVMMLGMSTAVFAANDSTVKDGKGADGAATTDATSLKIYKSVVVDNEVGDITVAYPTMTFNYTVAPKTPTEGANVKDSDNDVAAVLKGVDGGVSLSNSGVVTIPTGTVKLNANGQEIVDGALTVNVHLDSFTSPGIYRYEIKDTTAAATLTAPGVVRSDSLDKDYIFDVYIKDTGNGTLGVGGYVLTSEEVTHIDGDTAKDSGFDKVDIITTEVPGSDPERKLDANKGDQNLDGNDFYYTYNATLSKKVTGAMGDKNNPFEFTLTVTNTANSQNLNYYVDSRTIKTGNWTANTTNTFTENGTAAFIKDGETVTIYGLNPYATVNYTETNNTASTYTKVTVTDDGSYKNEKTSIAANGTVEAYTSAQLVETYAANAEATAKSALNVSYENNLAEVSPTGVVLRFAPYILMLAGAFFLIAFTRRRRVDDVA